MNKQDVILISIVIVIFFLIFGIFKITEKKDDLKAVVYYEDKLVLTIDLNNLEEKEYKVKGYNGMVSILAGNGRVKVEDENSPLHLCSKSGYISKSYETIVCLPNKIVIKIDSASELDAVIE